MKYSRSKRTKNGFTLIATILVVSLLTVLVVAATVVSQIEQQAQYNASRQEVARQNALFGLNQALNQLQTAAGPDRRVTARADILAPLPTGVSLPAPSTPSGYGYLADQPQVDAGQSYWTGVWKNTSNDYSGSAGNGLKLSPDDAPGGNLGPGTSFLYYDYLPNGSPNSPPGNTLSQAIYPSRTQLYNPSNVTWLISWPNSSVVPDPTKSVAAQLGSVAFPNLSNLGNTLSGANLVVPIMKKVNSLTSANATLNTSPTTTISAPLVPLLETAPNSTKQVAVGGYAYWVSDEGIKAKLNIPDPYNGISPTSTTNFLANQTHVQMAQSPAVYEALTTNSSGAGPYNLSNAIDSRSLALLVPTLESASFIDSTWTDFSSNPNTYSEDFTTYSMGVIADNFNGGLRQDLTAALENQQIWWSQFSDLIKNPPSPYNPTEQTMKLYSVNALSGGAVNISASNNVCLDGMRWDSLFLYYNLYKVQMPNPTYYPSTGFGQYGYGGIGSQCAPATLPLVQARRYQESNGATNLEIDPIYPLLALWNHNVSLALNQLVAPAPAPPAAATTPGQYDLYLYGSPIMVLYNPWDVNLQEPIKNPTQGAVELNTNIAAVDFPNDYNAFLVYPASGTNNGVDPGPTGTGSSTNTPAGLLGGNDIRTTTNPLTDSPLMPGELRVYGLAQSKTLAPVAFGVYPSNDLPSAVENTTLNASSLELLSQGYAYGNYEGFEATLQTRLKAYPANPNDPNHINSDNIYISGVQQVRSNSQYLSLDNYSSWPNMLTTNTFSKVSIGSPNFPTIGGFHGPAVLVDSVTNLVADGAPVSPLPPTPKLIMSLVDRMPGVRNGNDLAVVGANAGNNNATFVSAFPGFISGGAFLNPLSIFSNSYSRNYFNSGKLTVLQSSQQDISTHYFGAFAANSYIETGWQQDSVGISTDTNFNVVVKTMPRQPLISLGQFKNMNCHYYFSGGPSGELSFSFYPLGGSYQAGIPTLEPFAYDTNQVSLTENLYQDDNFLANEALFDQYFLSTVPPTSFNAFGGWSDGQAWPIAVSSFGQSYIDLNKPLPNSRLIYYNRSQSSNSPNHGNPPLTNTLSPNITDLQCTNSSAANIRKPAANLLINGAFNINSTSVEAWEALLTSTGASGKTTVSAAISSPVAPPNSPTASQTIFSFLPTETPFLNFGAASFMGPSAPLPAPNTTLFGLVKLTNQEIATLAKNIVAQIQMRGPALSLGDFLNHRLTAASNALSNSGALQAAIDNSGLSCNANTLGGIATTGFSNIAQPSQGSPTSPSYGGAVQPVAPNNSGYGIPGTFTQNDLVQVIAPVISARLDTFTIRACGKAFNPNTGATEATSYCEAVCQRVPEYMYSYENGQTDINGQANYSYDSQSGTITNASGVHGLVGANCALGRRFKVISIRWLNTNEI